MDVKGKSAKIQRPNCNSEGGDRGEDRLSTLIDDILIEIISHLPLRSAVITGCLSRRWRGLWKNITSIDISSRTSRIRISKFFSVLQNILMQIRSPTIHSFHLEILILPDWLSIDYYWLQQICHRNVRELKLTWPYCWGHPKSILPCYIFQTRSLVSLELHRTFNWEFPKDGDPIILPNLKKLSLSFHGSQLKCIEKLIKTCSLLEDLSLTLKDRDMSCNFMNYYSHQNLRRFSIKLEINCKSKVVINAPKLHYLNVYGRFDTKFCFEEEPVALREAVIRLDGCGFICTEGKELMAKFHEAISNVRFLTLNSFVLPYISNVFSNATRLTLDMKSSNHSVIVPSLAEMCPALDVLIIKLGDVSSHCTWNLNPAKHNYVSTSGRVIKWIEIEYFLPECCRPLKSFLELLEFLLISSIIASEHFNFRLIGEKYWKWGRVDRVERKKRMESDLCKVFDEVPLVSTQGEIVFVGEYCKMSRSVGPKVREASRKVIHFSCSSYDGFTS